MEAAIAQVDRTGSRSFEKNKTRAGAGIFLLDVTVVVETKTKGFRFSYRFHLEIERVRVRHDVIWSSRQLGLLASFSILHRQFD